MAKITIAYTAPAAPVNAEPIAEICSTFRPTNAACDLDVFNDTYYDTNVYGITPATSLEVFMGQMVAYPGVIAALRAAMAKGEFVIEFPTEDDILYYGELAPAVADQGFEITIEGSDSSED
jgi:hypothetical protein